jgi:predicted RNase H-like HicB family nuclease
VPMIAKISKKATKQITMKVSIVVEPDGGSFHAYCPAFSGLHVDGVSVEDAVKHAKEAVCVYVTSLIMHREPLPLGPDCSISREEQTPPVPRGALLRHVELQWPSLSMSGIS